MKKVRKLQIGSAMLFFLFLIILLAPIITHESPINIDLKNELCKPSSTHWFGCDANGTDIFSILIYGAKLSLEVGLIVTITALCIGLVIGSVAGWVGGWTDIIIMRILDCIFAFPGIILAIAISSVLGPSKYNVIFSLVATGWAGYTRLVRGEVRQIKTMEFVESAVALGASTPRLLFFHIWPNIISPLIVAATFGVAGAILAEASLSFLGVGAPPGTPSWGALLSYGKDVLIEAPHVAAFPGLAIMYTILTFHFLGEGLREYFDPKSKKYSTPKN